MKSSGIFTPSCAFIMLAAPVLQRLRRSPWVRAFLQGAIAAASWPLLRTAVVQPTAISSVFAAIVGVAALIALTCYKVPTW